jgi:hypothetical protein
MRGVGLEWGIARGWGSKMSLWKAVEDYDVYTK